MTLDSLDQVKIGPSVDRAAGSILHQHAPTVVRQPSVPLLPRPRSRSDDSAQPPSMGKPPLGGPESSRRSPRRSNRLWILNGVSMLKIMVERA